jgi:hypothetical protein
MPGRIDGYGFKMRGKPFIIYTSISAGSYMFSVKMATFFLYDFDTLQQRYM